MNIRRYILGAACLLGVIQTQAQRWDTYFAYNNVSQIALTPDHVYAVSDGSLFSVEKQTEKVRIYNRQSGLHSTGISCIGYDNRSGCLIVAYKTGKIDLLGANGVQYIGELYDKDMTQRKTIYNITIEGRMAYLSTHYGVQTLDLRENKLVDSYWLRPGGQETPIADVQIKNDSIYAFSTDSLYCAALKDNLVDYTVWHRELRSGRIAPDTDKGTHYKDGKDEWYAGGTEGIIRFTVSGRVAYKPQGPLNNNPYRLTTKGDKLWVVSGGRWTAQNDNPGVVMRYDGSQWTNIKNDEIQSVVGNKALDFMNVAVDPRDTEHYYVTSYGCGLFEFQGNKAVRQYLPASDNSLGSAVADNPTRYTRLDLATFDSKNRLWLMNAGSVANQLNCLDAAGEWHGMPLKVDNSQMTIATPGGFVLDNRNANYKWVAPARSITSVVLIDDKGTPFDESDDNICKRASFVSQEDQLFSPTEIRAMYQDRFGRLWLGTEQGIAVIDTIDFFASNAIIRPRLMDNNGEYPLLEMRVMALCQDSENQIWVGTENMGVYVLSEKVDNIVAHYTTDNSAMPSNSILSLARNARGVVYVGTAEGLVSYDPHGKPDGLSPDEVAEKEELDEGSMLQWRLHFSYSNPQEVVASPKRIYALADGALFSVDRETEELEYWNKANGLSGGAINHIAYDKLSGQLIITYEDGRIDLMHDKGNVQQMPDLYMKASSTPVTVNSITLGSRYAYLAMPFGVLVLNAGKAEMVETYYVGAEASAVDVKCVVELGDSLYAMTPDYIYSAALSDNLVDYTYWHKREMPVEGLQQAFQHNNELYIFADNLLYRCHEGQWQKVLSNTLNWVHPSEGQILASCSDQAGLARISDEGELSMLTANYTPTDAIIAQNDYWLAVESIGLVKLNGQETTYYQPEGPLNNFSYHLHAADGQIYVLPGGRWANEFGRVATVSIYNGSEWHNVPTSDIWRVGGIYDPVSIAVDPNDAGHFYVAAYGCGVVEFENYVAIKRYNKDNSTLERVNNDADPKYYTRTDGIKLDDQGNLWVLNATKIGAPIHVMTPDGSWHALKLKIGADPLIFSTPGAMWIDQRDSRYKWMLDQRDDTKGLILLDDNGTPTYAGDDQICKRSAFQDVTDSKEIKSVTPGLYYCIAQDMRNRIWVGTDAGIILFPAKPDSFRIKDACRRIIIPRNDGTRLGDYLLADEQINCMMADGGNRMWIGTASSGLYLIEEDSLTVEHFTVYNSSLPSNNILSIAIMPTTGEVFVGTDKGVASYRSDASEPQEDFSHAYAFPNPVRPNYGGAISIAGLMAETMVNIVDEGGNLVCKTRSHGGLAVWDGKLSDGRRATPGVYTALCNEPNGKHTIVKILVVH